MMDVNSTLLYLNQNAGGQKRENSSRQMVAEMVGTFEGLLEDTEPEEIN